MSEKPIVVGVDESPEAVRAARMGWELAAALRAPCRLIHVIPDAWVTPDLAVVPITPALVEQVVDEARHRIRDRLADAVPQAALDAIEISVGRAPYVLAEAAAGAQLVVVGGKTHGPLARGLGGSTAHFLVRSLEVPVLIVALAGWPVHRVLAAVDLSYAAEPTIAAARKLIAGLQARLRLLHVVEPMHAPGVVPAPVDEEAVFEETLRRFQRLTANVTEIEPADRVTRRGLAADTVAKEAAEWAADIVVVGSHGKGWIQRMLVGSTTERLMTLLPASLLIVPVRPVEKPTEWAESPTRVRRGMVII